MNPTDALLILSFMLWVSVALAIIHSAIVRLRKAVELQTKQLDKWANYFASRED